MTSLQSWDETQALDLVRDCVLRELPPAAPLPSDDEDLVKAEIVDSMGWVGILSSIEEATGIRNFGNPWPEERPQSIRLLATTVRESAIGPFEETGRETFPARVDAQHEVSIQGWGYSLGSLRLEAASVESECGLPAGTIRDHAGIESVCRANRNENEVTLAQEAAELALTMADVDPERVDWVVATSATFLNFPSLAAAIHTRLLLRQSCAAIDVGGACIGLLNGLATAKALLSSARGGVALVLASEVHSRRLSSPQVPGEFRGLFGDGACAFVLGCSNGPGSQGTARLGDFICGCSGAFASSLCLALRETNELEVQFKGEQLAGAALTQLGRIVDHLENRTGKPRGEVDYFALHEPNPRLVEIFAERANIPREKIPLISKSSGNLGSATCGVSLCTALSSIRDAISPTHRPVIFVAAVGPGILWAGTYLY